MTNEDAINLMGQLRMYISGGGVIDRKLDEAVMMAIDALKELGNQGQEVNNPNDCISRQAAIDAIQAHKHNVLDAREYDEGVACGYAAAHNHICDVIAILPSAQPESRWIPCSERLPEEPGNYLVSIKRVGWNYEEYVENDIAYWDDIFHKADKVIAWMPLPEPWKEGEYNEQT